MEHPVSQKPPVPKPQPAPSAPQPAPAAQKPVQPKPAAAQNPQPKPQPKPGGSGSNGGQGAKAASIRPPAGSSRLRGRHMIVIMSFVLCVVLPTILSGWYLWALAEDQYASKVGFSVRREEAGSSMDFLKGLTNISGSSSTDTDILFEFIQSQRLVAEMDAEINLRQIWTKPKRDPVFALTDDSSIEELVKYWNKMITLSYGTGSGLLEVEVRAFEAADAERITQTLFKKSSDMINDLSAIAREDSISYAREELDTALMRLRDARAEVTQFRNSNQIVNPEMDLQSQAGLLARLQQQQAETLIEIDLLADTARADDPRVEQARRKLDVIEKRISAERKKLGFGSGADDGTAFADLVGEYERLVVNREFAEKAYISALAAYDAALAESRRKSRYLAAYMEPTLAETPEYPHRFALLSMIALFLGLSWAITVLITYSLRDRR